MIRGLRPHQSGYTLVELMVVLAVSVTLVASAIALFNTRIPKTQFSQGITELESKLRSVSNDVSNGFYPNSGNFSCSSGTVTAGSAEQGTNSGCIFLGKVIQFAPSKSGCNVSSSQYGGCDTLRIYTVYGERQPKLGSNNADNLTNAHPKFLDQSVSEPDEYTTAYGLHFTGFANGSTPASGIAYIQTFGSSANISGDSPTGANQVNMYIQGPLGAHGIGELPYTSSGAKSTLDSGIPNQAITLCLQSGTSNQFALLTLGENGNPVAVTTRIVSDTEWGNAGC